MIWQRWRDRRRCFHHDHRTGTSWVGPGTIMDYRKLYECKRCGKIWII
jgi:hypothetical protein